MADNLVIGTPRPVTNAEVLRALKERHGDRDLRRTTRGLTSRVQDYLQAMPGSHVKEHQAIAFISATTATSTTTADGDGGDVFPIPYEVAADVLNHVPRSAGVMQPLVEDLDDPEAAAEALVAAVDEHIPKWKPRERKR